MKEKSYVSCLGVEGPLTNFVFFQEKSEIKILLSEAMKWNSKDGGTSQWEACVEADSRTDCH